MSWEWVAPVSTAAVGLGGMAATLLVANINRHTQLDTLQVQRSHEQEANLRAERKAAYLEFLDSIDEARRTLSRPIRPEAKSIRTLMSRLQKAFDEVALTAPDWLLRYASIALTRTLLWMAAIAKPEEYDNEHEALEKLVVARFSLLSAMKADITAEGASKAKAHIQVFENVWNKGREDILSDVP